MGVAGRIIMQLIPVTPRFVVRWIASRYVAGPDLASAVTVMQNLAAEGACFTIDVLHGQEGNLVFRFPDVEEGDDVRVGQRPRDAGLLVEALDEGRTLGALGGGRRGGSS